MDKRFYDIRVSILSLIFHDSLFLKRGVYSPPYVPTCGSKVLKIVTKRKKLYLLYDHRNLHFFWVLDRVVINTGKCLEIHKCYTRRSHVIILLNKIQLNKSIHRKLFV